MQPTDKLLIDQYELLNCLSTGQHSQVWEVVETTGNTGRRVAMKLLLEEALKEKPQINSLKHEHKVGSTLTHPNLLKYYDLVLTKDRGYFTMELFSAPNLKTQIYLDVGALQQRAHRVIELVALALEHLHQNGWVHRDIKPDNILATKGGEVRLIDFSLTSRVPSLMARIFSKKQPIQGTRTYMAPEQILQKPISPRTDIYSLGITLYEILTGQPPFKGSSPKDLLVRHITETAPSPSFTNKNVTTEMDEIVAKMLAKKPEQRYGTIGDFLADFRRVTMFKETPLDAAALKAVADAQPSLTDDSRLNSRADAKRTKDAKDEQDAIPSGPPNTTAAVPVVTADGVMAPVAAAAPPPRASAPAVPGAPPGTVARPPAGAPAGAAPQAPAARPPAGAPPAGGRAPQPASRPPAPGAPPRPGQPPGQPGQPAARPAGQPPAANRPAGAPPQPGQAPPRPAQAPPRPAQVPPRPAGAPAAGQPPRPQTPGAAPPRPAPPPGTRPAGTPPATGQPAPGAPRPPVPGQRPAAPPASGAPRPAQPGAPQPASARPATPPPAPGAASRPPAPPKPDGLPPVS